MGVPAGGEEELDLEQYKRETESFIQQYIDSVGRDTPEGKAVLREWEAGATPPRPTKAEPEETELIDLRLLVDSPIHRRHAPSSEELTALARSIEANGLKNPIEVRPDGDKFEIICGHRRVAAYRRLLDAAQTDSERAKYQAIRAKVRPGASDLEVIRQGIADDLLREEFSPADAARSIHALRHFEPRLDSAQKLSEATGVAFRRVSRYLQLGKAAPVVQEAADEGMMVDVEGDGKEDGDEGQHQERRKLDLLAALEFGRLHAALSTRGSGGERRAADPSSGESDEPYADRETRQAIERALTERWGYREVKRYVDKAIAALDTSAAKKVGRPRVAFKWRNQRLQIDANRLDALDSSQRAELRRVIEDILRRL